MVKIALVRGVYGP